MNDENKNIDDGFIILTSTGEKGCMLSHTRSPVLTAVAIAMFGLLSLFGGWLIVYGNGFHHAPSRTSSETIFITGMPALLMMLLQFLAAVLAFTYLFRYFLNAISAVWLAFILVFMPPVWYVLF